MTINFRGVLLQTSALVFASLWLSAAEAQTAPAQAAVPAQVPTKAPFFTPRPNTTPAPAPVLSQDELALAAISDVNVLLAKLEEYKTKKDLKRQAYTYKRLSELRPYAGGVLWELARTYSMINERTGAFDTMLRLQQQGFNFDPTGDPAFDNIKASKVFKYIVEGLQTNAKPFGEGKVAFTIQSDAAQIESLVFDPTRNRFFAASAATGEIFSVDLAGKTKPFISPGKANGLFGVYSMAVDAPRDLLYVGTTSLPSFKDFDANTFGQGGIAQFELSTGKLRAKYALPFDDKAHVISAMTVAPNGDVYAVDVATNTVYQLRSGKLVPLFSSPEFISLRGIAVTDDHKFLYLSDYESGLFIASLERNQIRLLTAKNQNLGGIDGLYAYKNQIIALQNGTSPTRVLRVLLGANGIEQVRPLEANKKAMSVPSFGTMKGNQIYFIGNSQRDLYDVNGKILPGAKPVRRQIYAVDADFGVQTQPVGVGPLLPKPVATPPATAVPVPK